MERSDMRASDKYDVVTALLITGNCVHPKHQGAVARFTQMFLLRFHWPTRSMRFGHGAYAKATSISERTAKRDTQFLQGLGYINKTTIGVKGSVSIYSVNIERVAELTREFWHLSGADYDARMVSRFGSGNVVPLNKPEGEKGRVVSKTDDFWSGVRWLISTRNPSIFRAWIDPLTFAGWEGDDLVLSAPSAFHATYINSNLIEVVSGLASEMAGRKISVQVSSVPGQSGTAFQ